MKKHMCLFSALLGLVMSGSGVSAQEVKFGAGKRIKLPGQTALEGPAAVDVDEDGKIDLLCGVYEGHLLFRKNTGTGAEPVFSEPVKIQSGTKDIKLLHW